MKLEMLPESSSFNQSPFNQSAPVFGENSASDVTGEMLRAGISAAKSGRRLDAYHIFTQVTDVEPHNEAAWLWLASISEYPEELIVFLNRVLAINPHNERAREWARATHALLAKTFVRRGIDAAAREDGHDFAKQCFLQAVTYDEQNEMAWLWLASIADSSEEKQRDLQKVLEINPANEAAQASLAVLSMKRQAETKNVAPAPEMKPAPTEDYTFADEYDAAETETLNETPFEDFNEPAEQSSPFSIADTETNFAPAADETDELNVPGNFAPPEYLNETMEDFAHSFDLEIESEFQFESEITAPEQPAEAVEFTGEFSNYAYQNEATLLSETEYAQPFTPVNQSFSEPASLENYLAEEAAEQAIDLNQTSPAESDFSENSSFENYNAEAFDGAGNGANDNAEESFPIENNENLNENSAAEIAFTPVAESVAANYSCPFCQETSDAQFFICSSCGAALTLANLEDLLATREVDAEKLAAAVRQMEIKDLRSSLESGELVTLGIGYLNLKKLRKGLECLNRAARIEPNNLILQGEVNALAIRLEEIERQTDIHSSQPQDRTILVVDDSATIRKLISGKLEKNGHTVVCAVDGMDALAKLGESTPDLVLLDITMPKMDGYQVCKLIRNNHTMKDVPVVMISGKDGFFDKVRGRMAGATGYITKPFGPETLMRTVETYVSPNSVGSSEEEMIHDTII